MSKRTGGWRRAMLCICTIAVWGLSQIACDEENPFGVGDGLTGGGADAGGGGDSCTEIEWGTGFAVGEVVANWEHTGYIDDDGDGVVEEEEVEFNLEDVHCSGAKTMVLIIGDTS